MATESKCWSSLPDHIIVHMFSYLPLVNRYQASQVCRSWNNCFKSQYLWQRFHFQFLTPSDARFVSCVQQFGQHLRDILIDVDQSDVENRENACTVINQLATVVKRDLRSFRIRFRGENPLFYAGAEFICSLKTLFGPPPESVKPRSLIHSVDLSGVMAAVDEEVLDLLSNNNPELRKLNIQINTLVCKITPDCILRLINRCRRLKDLRLYNVSVSEDVLLALIEDDRTPIEHLAITCRREEKYCKELSSVVWGKVSSKLPDLRVTLGFDPTCPLHKIWSIMKPEIPVSVMLLETYTRIYDEVNLATDCYKDTLEKIVINTVTSPEFEKSIMKMSDKCKKLQSMFIFNCILPRSVVEEILKNRPDMCSRGSYRLVSEGLPDRTIVGVESGD